MKKTPFGRMGAVIAVTFGMLAFAVSAQASGSQSCGTSNLSLGNGWTLVDCNAISSSGPGITNLNLVHGQAVNAHDLIVVFGDMDMCSAAGGAQLVMTDNAGNVFTKSPMSDGQMFNLNEVPRHINPANYWYVLDSAPKASGYQATMSAAANGGGTLCDSDMSVMVFRSANGQASPGLDSNFINMSTTSITDAVTGLTVPPNGQTLAVNYANDLIIGGGNINNAPYQVDAPFVGCDGDGVLAVPSYYTYCATSSAPGNYNLKWYDSQRSDGSTSGMFAIRAPSSATTSPSIATQPVNQTVGVGSTATFSVAAVGTAPLAYQWQENGMNISGATAASYTTPAAVSSDNGSTFQVIVTNSAGAATSSIATLTVNVPDTTAPSVPANLSVSAVSSSQISLAWAASSDPVVGGQITSGISGYRIFRGGLQIATSTSVSYSDSGLSPSTTYAYTVSAFDAAGNESLQSAAISTTTAAQSIPDTVFPAVSLTSPANGAAISGTASVSATASDNVGVVGVQFKLDGVNLGAEDASAPYAVSWDSTLALNGSHTLTAVARDAAGNASTSSPVAVTVANAVGITPAFVQESSIINGAVSSSNISLPSASSNGNLLIVTATYDNLSTSISSITDSKGNVYARAIAPVNWGGSQARSELWYAKNISGGGAPIAATIHFAAAPSSFSQVYMNEYSGLDAIAPLDQTASRTQSGGFAGTWSSGAKITASPDELVFGHCEMWNGSVSTGSGFTARSTFNGNIEEDKNVVTAGSYDASCFENGDTPIALMATFKGSTSTPLIAPASVSLNPASLIGGNSSIGKVVLNVPAPAGGMAVSLSSSNASVAAVPAALTVPAGTTTASFSVTTMPTASASVAVIISAVANGATKTATLIVTRPALSSLTLNPTSVKGPAPSTGTVTLSGQAPTGGMTVALSSSATAVATVPANVTVAAGATTATFTVTSKVQTASKTATISSVLNGTTKTAVVTVTK